MVRSRSESFKLKRAFDLAFAPDAHMLATISRDVLFWDTAAHKRIRSVHPFSHPRHLDFSPDGKRLAVKSTSGHIVVLDARTATIVTDCANQHEGEGAPLYFTPKGDALVDASWRGSLTVRDVTTGGVSFQETVGGMVHELSASLDRRLFAYTIGRLPPSDTSSPPEDLIAFRRWPLARTRPCILPVSRPFISTLSLFSLRFTRCCSGRGLPDALEVIDVSTADILAHAMSSLAVRARRLRGRQTGRYWAVSSVTGFHSLRLHLYVGRTRFR